MKSVLIAATLAALASAALSDPAATTPNSLGPCAGVYASASGLSDYRFDGFSESNRAPTWQFSAYCYRNDGFFVGTQLTGINVVDKPPTPLEADWYAGRQMPWRGASVTFELLYDSFPGKRAPGPSYDLVEPQVEVSRRFKRLTLGALGGWEDDISGGGEEWHLKASAGYAVTPWLALSGHAGRFLAASGADHDHDHWDVGATAKWRRLTLDTRYGGTDQPRSRCFYSDWCRSGAYASLSYRLLP